MLPFKKKYKLEMFQGLSPNYSPHIMTPEEVQQIASTGSIYFGNTFALTFACALNGK